MKPAILVTLGALWPGHESTGPNLSQIALCKALADKFDFHIIARDRPWGATAPIVDNGGWHDLGYAKIHYLTVGRFGARGLVRLLGETPHDLLVINSFFDREFSLPAFLWHKFGRGRKAPLLLSPRGEFSEGALSLKAAAKRGYRALVDTLGLIEGAALHATSQAEYDDLHRAFPKHPVHLVSNFRPLFSLPEHVPRAKDAPARLAFIGRISPVKGLDFALEVLAKVKVPVRYEIFGPPSDDAYWQMCQAKIASLPTHIEVVYRGEIANEAVANALARQDLLFLPSRSENFGHAIFESLAAGTPVLIGDRTPWRDLEAAHAGFDLPLNQPAGFAKAIETMAHDGNQAQWRRGARLVAEAHVAQSEAPSQMMTLFHQAMCR